MGAARNRELILCLLGIGAVYGISVLAYRLPAPPRDAAADVFSAYRARTQLERLAGDGAAHPIGSIANARLRGVILRRLADLGYDTQVQSGLVCNAAAICGTPSNIVAHLPLDPADAGHPASSANGAKSPDDAASVLLCAHYDSVPAGPGISDDAAGVATVLEIAGILKTLPPTRHPIVLLISDGEEAGLLGAMLFVRDHPLAKTIMAAVNLEARGTTGPSLMFETGSDNAWLMRLYRRAVPRPITDSVYYVGYKALRNDTDFSVFKSAGWQGFNFAYIGEVARYHTPLDDLAHAELRSIQHQGENALASLLALANADADRGPDRDAVYFDLLSRTLIEWPAGDSAAAAAVALLLLLAEAALLWRHRWVLARQIAWGCLGALACMIIAVAAAGAILWLLLMTGKVPPLGQYSWIAHPFWMNLVCAALAAGSAGISSSWLARRAGVWGSWIGAVFWMASSAVLEAALAPGLCFLSLLTAGAAVLAMVPSLHAVADAHTSRPAPADLALLVPPWLLFTLLIPMVALLYEAVGSVAWPIDTLLFSCGAMLMLPLLAAASARLRRGLTALSAVLILAGVGATLLLPTYSRAWPQRLNFAYVLNADTHSAFWTAQPDSLQLPDGMARAAAFDAQPQPAPNGGWTGGFRAMAPASDLAGPRLTLRAAPRQSAQSLRYELHLESARGAPEIEILFPSSAGVREIVLAAGAEELRVPLWRTEDGATRLRMVGLAPQGADLAVEVRGGPFEARLADRSFSLPGGEFLQRLRSPAATSSQEGDTTVVQSTVRLDPAAGR